MPKVITVLDVRLYGEPVATLTNLQDGRTIFASTRPISKTTGDPQARGVGRRDHRPIDLVAICMLCIVQRLVSPGDRCSEFLNRWVCHGGAEAAFDGCARRFATRYDKLFANFMGFVKLAAIAIWLHLVVRHY